MSYVDRRIGDGNFYLRVGFKYVQTTELNYWYTDLKNIFVRFKFRTYEGRSEKEIAAENKVYKFGAQAMYNLLINNEK
jgi:hypothetical protein